ncbi:hypothetical protein PQU63_05930 [Xanthomonas protegens]|uniref:Lipoprotein n=1 Tax=Xanthomonas protegens TaxID=3380705 RepID=A0ABU9LAF3_9XANT
MKGSWIVGMALLGACFTVSAAGRLDIRLEHAQADSKRAGAAVITITLVNVGDQPIAVPDAYIPEVSRDGRLQANLFRVLQEDGGLADYVGIHVSQLPGSIPDVILPPGESKSATVDLSLNYRIVPGRRYLVAVQPLLRYSELPATTTANVSGQVGSLKAAKSNRIEVMP